MRTIAGFLAVALVAALAGCGEDGGGPGPKDAWKATHRLRSDEAYYVTSPAQGRPPDGTWTQGTEVRFVEDAGSYARVEPRGGPSAYVSSGALEALP